MKTQQFLTLLAEHLSKALIFKYALNKTIGANYHITEVKHITIDAVDCGANSNSWHETLVQLWESPSERGKSESMSAYKALAILKKVDKIKSFDLNSEVKIEFGTDTFHTAQLHIDDFLITDNHLILKLTVEKVGCKAKDLCGVEETTSVTDNEPCCSPDGNCC